MVNNLGRSKIVLVNKVSSRPTSDKHDFGAAKIGYHRTSCSCKGGPPKLSLFASSTSSRAGSTTLVNNLGRSKIVLVDKVSSRPTSDKHDFGAAKIV